MLDDRHENAYAACTVLEGDDGRSYLLAGYRGARGCHIIETDGYLGIAGDLSPLDNRGVWSMHGCSLDWFVGATDEEHLASKFLRIGWYADLAEQRLRAIVTDPRAYATADLDAVRKLIARRPWNEGERAFAVACKSAGLELGETRPGSGYDPRDVLLLASLRAKIAAYRTTRAQMTGVRLGTSGSRGPTNLGQHMRLRRNS